MTARLSARVTRWFAAAAMVAAASLLSSGCGYSLAGRGSFLPDYLKTIAVPAFANRTTLFNLETIMTEKVRAEFISRGKYRIVPEAQDVDAVLTGQITGVNIAPVAFSPNQIASRYTITMSASVELRDTRENRVLWENASLIFRQDYDNLTGQQQLDPAAFFGQDQNALDRITSEFARSIVSAILVAF
jgi:hypothetical protein